MGPPRCVGEREAQTEDKGSCPDGEGVVGEVLGGWGKRGEGSGWGGGYQVTQEGRGEKEPAR